MSGVGGAEHPLGMPKAFPQGLPTPTSEHSLYDAYGYAGAIPCVLVIVLLVCDVDEHSACMPLAYVRHANRMPRVCVEDARHHHLHLQMTC